MDIKTLSAMLGHVSAATTLDIYTHITSDMSTTANIYAHLDSQSKNLSARTMAITLTLPKAPSVKEW